MVFAHLFVAKIKDVYYGFETCSTRICNDDKDVHIDIECYCHAIYKLKITHVSSV